jgi:hypothetical protein
MESLKEFLDIKIGSGSGSGSGYGYGYGYGSGYGDGSGYGSGYGSGSGYGYGDGSGYGSGYGSGSGSGDGYGSGSGSGYGYGVKSINNMSIYDVDGVPTIITLVKNNIVKGFIVNNDLTLDKCFVVKNGNIFAHGKTLKEAQNALIDKLFNDMNEDERIKLFLSKFNLIDKYSAKKFFDWHNKLTGSCLMGRESFCKSHNVDVDNDEFTVKEFVELTKNSYGGEIIRKILEASNE